tara:strand:+ start:330 stop:521 length:192 start_codon:yes stop_codon:yes gene_type:complete
MLDIGTAHDNGTYVTYHQDPHQGDVNKKGKQNEINKNSEAAEWYAENKICTPAQTVNRIGPAK